MFRAYLFKILRSPLTYAGILGVSLVCLSHILTSPSANYGSVLYRMDFFFGLDQSRKALTFFAALPFVGNFAEEWTSGVSTLCAARCGVRKYIVANAVLCVVVSFVTVFIGMFLFSWIFSFFVTFYEPNYNIDHSGFGYLAANGMPWLYYAIQVATYAFSVAMWCMTGLLLSALLPNKFVAVCTPLITSYVIERFTLELPTAFNTWLMSINMFRNDNRAVQLLYPWGFFLAFSVVFGIVFYFIAEKRLSQ